MDWNRVEGNWKQFKGKAKEKWGKLTDDDLNVRSATEKPRHSPGLWRGLQLSLGKSVAPFAP